MPRGLLGRGQTLISCSKEGGTPCKAGNARCWGPASGELEPGEALPCGEGSRCSYGYPGRCCQAQDPGTQLCRAPAKLRCPQTAAPGPAQLQLGCWQGFRYPQASQGLCPPAPKRTWVLRMLGCIPVGAPMPWTVPQLMVAIETLWTGQRPQRCGTEPGSVQPVERRGLRARSAAGGRGARSEGCGLSPARSRRCREASRDLQGRRLVPGTGPDPGRFTCSLIRERGQEGAGLGERRRVGTGRLRGVCGRWRAKLSPALPASSRGGTARGGGS